ncbi:hypothetical protein GCM10017774_75370 [Lentzea cavernae]|uniref:Nucleoside phosphorylase domain-containing protein n=1 Tax=Lentzea cavernae TaxID=2020703 RepID=A0ABQ3MRU2_9PSEU|nr:hypothetical protein GCM10017774_75370 [Lentzea cavernae]
MAELKVNCALLTPYPLFDVTSIVVTTGRRKGSFSHDLRRLGSRHGEAAELAFAVMFGIPAVLISVKCSDRHADDGRDFADLIRSAKSRPKTSSRDAYRDFLNSGVFMNSTRRTRARSNSAALILKSSNCPYRS